MSCDNSPLAPDESVDTSQPNKFPPQIDVWSIPLVPPPHSDARYRSVLSEDELVRADRFLQDKHRRRFITGRARLRALLGQVIGQHARNVHFRYENLGKPWLERAQNDNHVSFNFSNSAELGLLAISPGLLDLGIDLEYPRALYDLIGLATRYFHRSEVEKLEEVEGIERQSRFFRCWTRKEAYLKAIGKGLTFPLNEVVVTLEEHVAPAIREICGDSRVTDEWHVHSWEEGPPYVGAIVYRSGQRGSVRLRAWNDELEGAVDAR